MRTGRPRERNAYWIIGPVAVIDISTPKHPMVTCMVDVSDINLAIDGRGRWSARMPTEQIYAARFAGGSSQLLSRIILDAPAERLVDHKNRDTLDNRRCNLRLADRCQNNHNSKPRAGTSRFKGVSLHKLTNRWQAQIHAFGVVHYLGLFKSEEDAARAYDAAAKLHHKEFARLNLEASK